MPDRPVVPGARHPIHGGMEASLQPFRRSKAAVGRKRAVLVRCVGWWWQPADADDIKARGGLFDQRCERSGMGFAHSNAP